MATVLRTSVRELVEFTLHGEDISSGGSLKDMQDGTVAHKARQGLFKQGWEAEVTLKWEQPLEDDLSLCLNGRMDGYCPGDIPTVEEIKLCQPKYLPDQPIPAHWAQAAVYGYIVCQEDEKQEAEIILCYVSIEGEVLRRFQRTMTLAELEDAYQAVLIPYVKFQKALISHRSKRDQSIESLAFPYDTYRPGQREMAVQVYTAIRLRKRLFASLPTGTGKSAASLFPALKAICKGETNQLFYLTARNTARQGPVDSLVQMRDKGLHIWSLVLDAKDKQCPNKTRCHPDFCPRAKGHFVRLPMAVEEMQAGDGNWTTELILKTAEEYMLCPYEFALALTEIADVVICDYNYAFDPGAQIQRIFQFRRNLTLLIDESHHLQDRARDMLSGSMDTHTLRTLRRDIGKIVGRKNPLYIALTAMLKAVEALALPTDEREGVLPEKPILLSLPAHTLLEALSQALASEAFHGPQSQTLFDLLGETLQFIRAMEENDMPYAPILLRNGKEKRLELFCLSPAKHLAKTTKGLRGIVCFSATLSPLTEMRTLLGGNEEDACFAMPSPFPPENLLVMRARINTRYAQRERTAPQVAALIRTCYQAHEGKYIVFFPSFAYLRMMIPYLEGLPLLRQESGMDEKSRQDFLDVFQSGDGPALGLCVLGGLFAEGIDLPGTQLDGVFITGVGLPQLNLHQEVLRNYYQETLGNGFWYAYQIPGMQKVMQAVGRVIRRESDRGLAVLMDDRFFQPDYEALCPPHWQYTYGDTNAALNAFWAVAPANI